MSWQARALIGITIASTAVVFPWWVWIPLLFGVTLWLHPYWEGILLMLTFDLLYGGFLPDVQIWSMGGLSVRYWMLYMTLFVLLFVFLPKPTERQVY
jgi:hypothetical protein